jgi:hypothetical protein
VRLDESMTEPEIKASWLRMDFNGDGEISLEEFSAWWLEEDCLRRCVKGTCLQFLPGPAGAAGLVVGDSWGNISQFSARGTPQAVLPNKPGDAD